MIQNDTSKLNLLKKKTNNIKKKYEKMKKDKKKLQMQSGKLENSILKKMDSDHSLIEELDEEGSDLAPEDFDLMKKL